MWGRCEFEWCFGDGGLVRAILMDEASSSNDRLRDDGSELNGYWFALRLYVDESKPEGVRLGSAVKREKRRSESVARFSESITVEPGSSVRVRAFAPKPVRAQWIRVQCENTMRQRRHFSGQVVVY